MAPGLKTVFLIFTIAIFPFKTAKSLAPGDTIPSPFASFEKKLEHLRNRYHIPGFSAGIVYKGRLVWKKGFGYADISLKKVPDEYTLYEIASVTKTFGSILLMQQVEKGTLSLDDPIAKYKINLGARWQSDPRIRLKHLLTHTAMGGDFNGFKPGYQFRYNGFWYQQLGQALTQVSGQSVAENLQQEILDPLQLRHTVPTPDDSASFAVTGQNADSVRQATALPYDWKNKQIVPVTFKYGFGVAAGIRSCVADLAVYAAAIDEGKFLKPETWNQVFTPFVTPKGKKIQYGLGWFIEEYRGMKVTWHTGWWTGYSALFLRVPEKDLTFIILANSQDLSRPFYHIIHPVPGLPLAMSDPFRRSLNKHISASAFAKAFLDYFVSGSKSSDTEFIQKRL
ncbi:CubicO group peptidase (beta-lactamase class C family) [Chitinophaga terrae (ex Kim and Jung 2007)]|uniref:serine hydrolase domain-containing protein n=1 Tax=Chitinophaga terrae (ex Kim and Jung 2007) TaxID=408074 RepID=UPI002786CAA8|nr:serine hydrolase domain-containing protein [Chitinophaga terrae (ex Kim and Jung 2007)]MDQ0109599.1 CubicO group peptidase (beta-lactamase class C family) [Chitinophaga terrae (ex Kim and Jung 2007)]